MSSGVEERVCDLPVDRLPITAAAASPPAAAALLLRHWTAARVVLALALAAGAALRFTGLGTVGLNSDEAVYSSQAASLAGNSHFVSLFPVVRAHPLLFQMLLSPLYREGVPDTAGRYVAAAFGVATIAMVYLAGKLIYSPRVGALAALFLALMPYHVTVSRQIILDGPMSFFTTAALACCAASARTGARRWLVAAGMCLGLAALCKETAVILVGSMFVFVCLLHWAWRPVRYPLAAAAAAVGLTLVYPVLTALAGGAHGGQSYLLWQLTRQPNHSFDFYLTAVGASMGLILVAVAVFGLLIRPSISWREMLLLSWLGIPLAFFEVWPTKGYSYLMSAAPVVALLAARAVVLIPRAAASRPRRLGIAAAALVASLCTVVLAVPAVHAATAAPTSGLAGAGGTPGGRETGRWVADHLPASARLLTIGPSMANLIRYYSGRQASGLSVSSNPLHRNPSYTAVPNPDAALRSASYQYVVWDAYSARRSARFGAEATTLALRFRGRIVYVNADESNRPLIVIYQVTPPANNKASAPQPPEPPVRQPNSAVLFAGYGGALGFGIAVFGWAAGVGRRRRSRAAVTG
jgi:hypothetical protein